MQTAINKDFMIHLDLYLSHCTAEFYINDIPIRRMEASENFFSLNAHHLLLDGINQLQIVVNPGETPSTAKQSFEINSSNTLDNNAKACMKLVKYPVGAFAGDDKNGTILATLNWELSTLEEPPKQYPVIVTGGKDFGAMLGPWLWQQCEPIQFENELPSIQIIAQNLYNSFIKGDANSVVNFAAPSLRDIGKALPAYGEAAFKEDMMIDIASNADTASLAPAYAANKTDFRLVGNGRLVQLINKDWENTIVSGPDEDGETYELPAIIGKVRNKWFLVL